MIAYIIRRLFQLVIVLFGVTLITFGMLKLVPGDPAVALAGKGATPERIAFVRHERGLDRPFYVQYVKYVQALVKGDLGESLYTVASGRGDDQGSRAGHHPAGRRRRAHRAARHPARACTRRCGSTRSGTRRSPRAL